MIPYSVLRGDRRILHQVSLSASAGERVGIIGANGAGKSTLLASLVGAVPIEDGTLLLERPEVLLLDEPTNHLALALAEALECALEEYPGAVVIASHDRWLRRRWQGQVLRLSAGEVDH